MNLLQRDSSEVERPATTFVHLSVFHHKSFEERRGASLGGGDYDFTVFEDPITQHHHRLSRQSFKKSADLDGLFDKYAEPIRPHLFHGVLACCDFGNTKRQCEILQTYIPPAHRDFHFPIPYDASWMTAIQCEEYAFYFMRRERPAHFVLPLATVDPIGLMQHQGYRLTSEPKNFDIVMYANRSESGKVEPGHIGIWYEGRVISKNLYGNVALHAINLGARTGSHFLLFTKPFDPNLPVPDLQAINDWIQLGPLVCRMNLPAWNVLAKRARGVICLP